MGNHTLEVFSDLGGGFSIKLTCGIGGLFSQYGARFYVSCKKYLNSNLVQVFSERECTDVVENHFPKYLPILKLVGCDRHGKREAFLSCILRMVVEEERHELQEDYSITADESIELINYRDWSNWKKNGSLDVANFLRKYDIFQRWQNLADEGLALLSEGSESN